MGERTLLVDVFLGQLRWLLALQHLAKDAGEKVLVLGRVVGRVGRRAIQAAAVRNATARRVRAAVSYCGHGELWYLGATTWTGWTYHFRLDRTCW